MSQTRFSDFGIKAEETVLIDDQIYNQHAAINVGASPISIRCEFTGDLPEELSWIKEVKDITELKDFLQNPTELNKYLNIAKEKIKDEQKN